MPPIEIQLQSDRIDPRSRLADVVRNSQDAELLCDAEFTDRLGLPLWLRINFRQGHPNYHFRCDDPGYGYPRVLFEAHEWLVENQNLRRSDHPQRFSLGPLSPHGAGSISATLTGSHVESDIKINPATPNEVIAASNTNQNQAQFRSVDGGLNWAESALPLQRGERRHADPGVAWSGSVAWATAIVYLPQKNYSVHAYRFDPASAVWRLDGTVSGNTGTADRPVIWGDSYTGNLYVLYSDDTEARMARRTTGNSTWICQTISGSDSTLLPSGGDVTTNAAGDVYVFWPERRSDGKWHLLVRLSLNAGAAFGSATEIAVPFGRPSIDIPSFVHGAFVYVSAAAFSENSRRVAYASWTDLSGEPGCSDQVAAQEPKDKDCPCKTRIWFTRLRDGQVAWDTPSIINPSGSNNDQFNQRLAVDPETGIIGIVYYDTIDDPDRQKTHLYFQSSGNEGRSWTPPLRLSAAPTDETSSINGDQYGDYNGLTAFRRTFIPSWTDRSGNVQEEIWTSVQTCPSVPDAVTASAALGHVDVAWASSDGASSYRVLRSSTSGGPYSAVQVVMAPTVSFLDGSVAHGQSYFYTVVAIGACESKLSVEAAVTVQ